MVLDDSRPRYLPHRRSAAVLAMGLAPVDDAAWIEVDSSLWRFHEHKRRLFATRPGDVYRWLPGSLPAQRELAAVLIAHLLAAHGDSYRREGDRMVCSPGGFAVPWPPPAPDPLRALSLLVAEDLLLLQPGDGGYRLTAASLCSPSHWRLAEKLGRPLQAIHEPVPGIQEALSPRIDRFLARLRPGRPVQRFNWSLQTDPALFHDGRSAPAPAATRLYYRVERQTLRRLPESGAVVFTIRVFLHPLDSLRACPGALEALFAAVDAMPPGLAAYKGFGALRAPLERYRLS